MNELKKLVFVLSFLFLNSLIGCISERQESNEEIIPFVSISELKLHPERYLNKNVTTCGRVIGITDNYCEIWDNQMSRMYMVKTNNIDFSGITLNAIYYFTGKFVLYAYGRSADFCILVDNIEVYNP